MRVSNRCERLQARGPGSDHCRPSGNLRTSSTDARPNPWSAEAFLPGGWGFRRPTSSSTGPRFDASRERETPMQSSGALRPVVIPGEAVGGPGLKPGPGTYSEGGRVFAAQLGIRNEQDGLVSVIPLSGRYIPQRGDAVIGEVTDLGASHWLVDINSPYPAPLHATESPWRVEFGDTSPYPQVGDGVFAQVGGGGGTQGGRRTERDQGARPVR